MKIYTRFVFYLVGALLAVNTAFAAGQKDAKALEVLESMSAYTSSLDRVVLKSVSLKDARLGAGLMVTNSAEIKVTIDRPASLHISSFDGDKKMELFFHKGMLTVLNSADNFYAQADIPEKIDAALKFALEELDVEAPLMDMIYRDSATHLIDDDVSILYLTDKARVAGTDCHHIALRGPEADVQLWVENGNRPLPRKIMITSKWEAGSPRFTANMIWDSEPDFSQDVFEFNAPDGAVNIGFAAKTTDEGE